MVKVHLIGHGKWGAVIDNAINDINQQKNYLTSQILWELDYM